MQIVGGRKMQIVLCLLVFLLVGALARSEYELRNLRMAQAATVKNSSVAQKPEPKKNRFDGPDPTKAKSFKVDGLWRKDITIGHHDPWKEDVPVVLHLWGPWCGPCRRELPALLRFSRRHPDLFIAAVSVNNEKKDVLEFLRLIRYDETKSHAAIFIGSEKDIIFADNYYNVSVFPTTLFIDRDGTIVKRIEGVVEWQNPEFEKFVKDFSAKKEN